MRDSKSRYYSDLELVSTFEKIVAGEFFEVTLKIDLLKLMFGELKFPNTSNAKCEAHTNHHF